MSQFLRVLTWLSFVCLTWSQQSRVIQCDLWERPVEDITSESQLFSLIPRPETGKVTENNILLAIYEDACSHDIHHAFFEGAQYNTGPGVIHLAAMHKNVYPSIVNEWNLLPNCSSFTFISRGLQYGSPSISILNDQNVHEFSNWLHLQTSSWIVFNNGFGDTLQHIWFDKAEHHRGEISINENRNDSSFLGHIFLWRDHNNRLIDWFRVHGNEEYTITETTWCKDRNLQGDACEESKEKELIRWSYELWARKRESLNWIQPKVIQTFTEKGFRKTTLYESTFKEILKWWNIHKHNMMGETIAGPVMNQRESPTFMAHLEHRERELLIEELRNRLEEWSGLQPLQMTSLYGIRKYTRHAVLGFHVDTCRTHVISAIINVDQKVDEDWPLQIYDHDGIMHSLAMKPGDVVFYESATCNHARQEPLKGDFYANIFIHFQPTGRWDCDML